MTIKKQCCNGCCGCCPGRKIIDSGFVSVTSPDCPCINGIYPVSVDNVGGAGAGHDEQDITGTNKACSIWQTPGNGIATGCRVPGDRGIFTAYMQLTIQCAFASRAQKCMAFSLGASLALFGDPGAILNLCTPFFLPPAIAFLTGNAPFPTICTCTPFRIEWDTTAKIFWQGPYNVGPPLCNSLAYIAVDPCAGKVVKQVILPGTPNPGLYKTFNATFVFTP